MNFNLLDTEGGHILVSLILITGGMIATAHGVIRGDDLVVFSLGVLGRSMKGANGNGNGSNGAHLSIAPVK